MVVALFAAVLAVLVALVVACLVSMCFVGADYSASCLLGALLVAV